MRIFRYGELASTNDTAQEFISRCSEFCISAEYQTKGRGRNGNVWRGSEGKNLYLSFGIAFEEPISSDSVILFQAIGAIAVKWALDRQINSDINLDDINDRPSIFGRHIFKIKYPNDVFALDRDGRYKKISGLLLENNFIGSECESIILGIGINLWEEEFPNDLRNPAISLYRIVPSFDKEEILQDIITAFNYYRKSFDNSFSLWKEALGIEGKTAKILGDDEYYTIKEVTKDMRLLALSEGKTRYIDNGDSIRYGEFIQKGSDL